MGHPTSTRAYISGRTWLESVLGTWFVSEDSGAIVKTIEYTKLHPIEIVCAQVDHFLKFLSIISNFIRKLSSPFISTIRLDLANEYYCAMATKAENGNSKFYEDEETLKKLCDFLRSAEGPPVREAVEMEKRVYYLKGTFVLRGMSLNHLDYPLTFHLYLILFVVN